MIAVAIAALGALVAGAVLPGARRGGAPYLVAGLWAYAVWRTRGARIRAYHRARYQRAVSPARPTRSRRARPPAAPASPCGGSRRCVCASPTTRTRGPHADRRAAVVTATHVDGRKVVEDQAAKSPLHTETRPVLFKQIRELLLDDGSVVYGCLHCDYTAATIGIVRPHLKTHTGRGADRPRTAITRDVDELSIGDLLRRVKSLEQAETDREAWRKRALDAERRLRTLRRALNGGES